MTCEQAQLNANAIVNYPLALQSLEFKKEMITLKENELFHTKAGFEDVRKLWSIEKVGLTDSYNRELSRKKRWKIATGILTIIAGAFYVK